MTGAEAVVSIPAPQHVERRRLPRPKPEHVLALVADLTAARKLLDAPTELERLAAVATIAMVERWLTNLAGAMEQGR